MPNPQKILPASSRTIDIGLIAFVENIPLQIIANSIYI